MLARLITGQVEVEAGEAEDIVSKVMSVLVCSPSPWLLRATARNLARWSWVTGVMMMWQCSFSWGLVSPHPCKVEDATDRAAPSLVWDCFQHEIQDVRREFPTFGNLVVESPMSPPAFKPLLQQVSGATCRVWMRSRRTGPRAELALSLCFDLASQHVLRTRTWGSRISLQRLCSQAAMRPHLQSSCQLAHECRVGACWTQGWACLVA